MVVGGAFRRKFSISSLDAASQWTCRHVVLGNDRHTTTYTWTLVWGVYIVHGVIETLNPNSASSDKSENKYPKHQGRGVSGDVNITNYAARMTSSKEMLSLTYQECPRTAVLTLCQDVSLSCWSVKRARPTLKCWALVLVHQTWRGSPWL